MELKLLIPRGFCSGVVKAYQKAKKVAVENAGKNIYMLGYIVHNTILIKELKELGIQILNDKEKTRMELIDDIDEGVLILSAHGTPYQVVEKARKKGLQIEDATCEYVYNTHGLVKDWLKEKDIQIVFIGSHNHPETIGVCALSDSIHMVTNVEEVKKLNLDKTKRIHITNQTTLSQIDMEEVVKELKNKYPKSYFKNDLCDATTTRQNAVLDLKGTDIDLLIVVGDIRSNNSKKLCSIANQIGIKSYLIDSLKNLKTEWLDNAKNVSLTSGASTPPFLTKEIAKFIKEY